MSQSIQNQPIESWRAGDTVQGFALLSRKEVRQDRNQRTYFDLELTDATGSISGKVWSDSPALSNDYSAHDFIAFQGTVKLYREQLQISLDKCRVATDADRDRGFDETQLIPSTKEDIGDLYGRLERLLEDHVEDPMLQRLAQQALDAYGEDLRVHPAAKGIHHAYLGGLLEHVVSMMELAVPVSNHFPEVDRDLVLLGVLFHDLGKIRELGAMPANDYTLEGRLVGHVVIGRDLLRECARAVPDFPADVLLELEHLVLSHQGRLEFASPVEPMTPEAFVLHALDDLDSKLNQLRGLKESESEQGDLIYVRALGRFVYLRPEEREPEPPSEDDLKKLEGRFSRHRPDYEEDEEEEVPAPSLFD